MKLKYILRHYWIRIVVTYKFPYTSFDKAMYYSINEDTVDIKNNPSILMYLDYYIKCNYIYLFTNS